MATPITNIGLGDIQTEFGGSPEISLTEYYRKDAYVPEGQEKSEHHPVRIPLVPQFIESGDGPGSFTGYSEISIGMFRGLSKKFKHTFNITADRFTTFNLKTELNAVGWSDTTIPVDVIINISPGVYVVSNSANTPTIDVGDVFPAKSALQINNKGFIYGRGGDGGRGGVVYPTIPCENGKNGGDAIKLSIPTKIKNEGVISGGGGGGGGGSGVQIPLVLSQAGDGGGVDIACVSIKFVPGGGGCPFGQAGATSILPGYGDWGTSAFNMSENFIFDRQEPHQQAQSASLTTPGTFGGTRIFNGNWLTISGEGGIPGSSGTPGHNPGWSVHGTAHNFFLDAGRGGAPGKAIVGMSHVRWEQFGKVLGDLADIRWSKITGSSITFDITGNLPSTSYTVTNCVRHYPLSSKQYRAGITTQRTSGWPETIPKTFSYSTETSLVDYAGSYPGYSVYNGDIVADAYNGVATAGATPPFNLNRPSSIGSLPNVIRYAAICENPYSTPLLVRFSGTYDGYMSFVSVNGVAIDASYVFPKRMDTFTPVFSSFAFTVPPGASLIEIGLRDDNLTTSIRLGNTHMVYLNVASTPNNQVLVSPENWIVSEVRLYAGY